MKLAGDWAPGQRKVCNLPWCEPLLLNLEGPISCVVDGLQKTSKAGPHLINNVLPESTAELVLTLANNHLMDYGESGLRQTISDLDSHEIKWVGAGMNAYFAGRALVLDYQGARIGILSRCEVQFGVATDRRPGVAAFDASVYQAIRELKRKCDVVIASIHAAAEMCPWPSPRRQDSWHALIDAGADVVHGHHAHIPQGWESYEHGLIFYGLGNFCVDPQTWARYPNTLWSLAPELSWAGGQFGMRLTTAVVEDLGETIRVRDASRDEADEHRQYLEICNRPLSDRLLLEALWQEMSVRMYLGYYADWLRFEPRTVLRQQGWWLRVRRVLSDVRSALRRSLSTRPVADVSQSQYLLWYHLFACESHHDAIATALGVLGGELEDLRTPETARLVDDMMPPLH
jgi:poly-gamma-glutamate synthesis protein (capsule biosynthesis protein)